MVGSASFPTERCVCLPYRLELIRFGGRPNLGHDVPSPNTGELARQDADRAECLRAWSWRGAGRGERVVAHLSLDAAQIVPRSAWREPLGTRVAEQPGRKK